MLPSPGDFGVKKGGGFWMWLVRLGTFSRYGHACVVVSTDGQTRIVEARPEGVRERPVTSNTEFRWSTGGPVVLSTSEREVIIKEARATLGRGYDWPSIAGFIVRFLGAKFGYSPDHPDNKLMCSELVVWCYQVAGIHLFPGRAPGDISPGELAEYCPPATTDFYRGEIAENG